METNFADPPFQEIEINFGKEKKFCSTHSSKGEIGTATCLKQLRAPAEISFLIHKLQTADFKMPQL